MTTPYTDSRARVLRAYRAMRASDRSPAITMEAVVASLSREVAAHAGSERELAEAAWDLHHARRYLRVIDQRALTSPFWGGRVKA